MLFTSPPLYNHAEQLYTVRNWPRLHQRESIQPLPIFVHSSAFLLQLLFNLILPHQFDYMSTHATTRLS